MSVFCVTARSFLHTACVCVIAATLTVNHARSETSVTGLRAEQASLFDAMRADPQNLGLMFEYAGVSARLEDYEAAISTLERMLIFNADLPRVRLELGALYFRIGSYATAERYFSAVDSAPDLPEPVRQRVAKFRAEIAKRTRRHHVSGRVELGITHDSNASLSPTDRDVFAFGRRAQLTEDSLGESDTGVRFLAELSHRYVFGDNDTEFWKTDMSVFGRRYEDVDVGATEAFFIRTGPQLALDEQYFGPKLRPFIDATHVRVDDEKLYSEGGVGLEYRDILGEQWSSFATVRAGVRTHRDNRSDEDGGIVDLRSGVAYSPLRDLVLTASIGAALDLADADHESNTEGSVRLTASFAYDPGLPIAGDKWRLSGYVSGAYRRYDAPDPVVTSEKARRDTDLRVGAQHVFNFRQGIYASVGVSALQRNSNLSNFELENVGVSAALGYSF